MGVRAGNRRRARVAATVTISFCPRFSCQEIPQSWPLGASVGGAEHGPTLRTSFCERHRAKSSATFGSLDVTEVAREEA
jgi:hypothetical protein